MAGRLLGHLEMWRPYTLCYVGLVGLSGALLVAPGLPGWRLLGAWAATTLGWLAGLYGGDYRDRHLDALTKPHRPIPSGRVSPRTALGAMIVCVAAGGAVALSLNWRTFILVAAALGGGSAYSIWLKGSGLSGNLVRGTLSGYAFLCGTMAAAAWPPARLLPVACVWWFQDSGSNLVGTLRDTAGDRRGGYRTLVVQHGERVALICVCALYSVAAGLASWAITTIASHDRQVAAALAVTALVLVCVALGPLLTSDRPIPRRIALRAHKVLVVERVILAGAMIALAAQGLALALTAVMVAVTIVSQRFMRERYEFGYQDWRADAESPRVAERAEGVGHGRADAN